MDQRILESASSDDLDSSTGDQFLAIFIVIAFAGVGGFLTMLLKGLDIKPNKLLKEGFKMRAVSEVITIPVLVGIIVFGCIARNWFPQDVMEHYPNKWAEWIRTVCLSIILMRGGLELDFQGKGIIVVLLTLVPQICEASTVAFFAWVIFDMPISLCFALGFILGAVSPAVLVPSCMVLQKQGYGVAKGIPTTLIAASSFDDIIAITVFGVCQTTAFANEGATSASPGLAVLKNVYQIAAGLAIGLGVGYSMKVFNKYEHTKKLNWIKFTIMLFAGLGFPILCDLIGFHESKYIGIIFFGWMCHYHWGEKKPEVELGQVWQFMQIALFGTVGAAVMFNKIESSVIGKGLVVIFCGVSARWLATFSVGYGKGFTTRESAFMGFAWIPKATVQAAIGGVVLSEAEKYDLPEYEDYGVAMLTTAVFAIVFTAPIGAILTNTLGPIWLSKAELPDKTKATDLEIQTSVNQMNKDTGLQKTLAQNQVMTEPEEAPGDQDNNVRSVSPTKLRNPEVQAVPESEVNVISEADRDDPAIQLEGFVLGEQNDKKDSQNLQISLDRHTEENGPTISQSQRIDPAP